MKIHPPYNPKPKTDLDGTTGKNLADKLVKPAQELTKSVIETSNKVQEHKIYDKAINNSVHRNR